MRINKLVIVALLVFGTLSFSAARVSASEISLSGEPKVNFLELATVNKPVNEILMTPVKEEIKDQRLVNILSKWKTKQIEKWKSLSEQPFQINASAYTASADECGNDKGITASGLKTEANRTLACPPAFPFGAKIEIEGMGTYVCEDRGGAIKGNHIDIYMETKREALAFGRQNLNARVIIE